MAHKIIPHTLPSLLSSARIISVYLLLVICFLKEFMNLGKRARFHYLLRRKFIEKK